MEPTSHVTAEASIPLTDRQAAHVAGLEEIIRRKNQQIAALQADLAAGESSKRVERKIRKAYDDGWEAAANRMMNLTQKTAIALRELRDDAFNTVLEGERNKRNR